MKTAVYYDEIFLKHNDDYHPENKNRLIEALKEIENSDIKTHLTFEKPKKANFEEIAKVHDRYYIEEIKDFSTAGGGMLDPDTYANEFTYDAALFAAGAIAKALEDIKDGKFDAAFCLVRPPGHHAEFSKAMGFCIFNNVAIGAQKAKELGFKKIYIADFDVHHCNGTQRTFYEDDTVFVFSTHQYPFYPGTGSREEMGANKGYGYTLNVPLKAYSDDAVYEKVYKEEFRESFLKFNPDILLVSAGYDLHKDDPLGGMNVSSQGIKTITNILVQSSKELSIPVIFTLEGGYNYRATAKGILDSLYNMVSA